MDVLGSQFALFQKSYVQEDDDTTRNLLVQLERDPRMREAWQTLDRHDPTAFNHVLYCLLSAKWRADRFPDHPAKKAEMERYSASLGDAAKLLLSFFSQQQIPPADSSETAESCRIVNENIRDARQSITWAAAYVSDVDRFSRRALERDMPASQKREAPHVAFGVMLCRHINDLLGQPLYSFVARAATVTYQLKEELSEDAVRHAYTRDKGKRASVT